MQKITKCVKRGHNVEVVFSCLFVYYISESTEGMSIKFHIGVCIETCVLELRLFHMGPVLYEGQRAFLEQLVEQEMTVRYNIEISSKPSVFV